MYNHSNFDAGIVSEEVLNEVRTNPSIDLDEVRVAYKKAHKGNKTGLTDEELYFLFAGLTKETDMDTIVEIMDTRVDGEDDGGDETDEEKELKEDQEKITVDRQTANTLTASAKAFAAKYLNDKIMDQMITIQIAHETSVKGVAIMLVDRTINEATKWEPEVWDMIPDPRIDTKQAKEMQRKGTNQLLPRFSFKDGSNRNRVADWFDIAVRQTPQVTAYTKELEDIEIGGSDVKDKTPDQRKWQAAGKEQRDRRAATLNKRIETIVNRWKRMHKAYLVMKEINELSKTLRCELLVKTDKEGEVIQPASLTEDADCFVLWKLNAKGERLINESFIPNTFLRLDPSAVDDALVKEHGNYYDALLSTKDREPRVKDAFPLPKTMEDFMGVENTMQTFYSEPEVVGQFARYFANIKDEQEKIEVATTIQKNNDYHSNMYRIVRPFIDEYDAKLIEAKAKKKAAA